MLIAGCSSSAEPDGPTTQPQPQQSPMAFRACLPSTFSSRSDLSDIFTDFAVVAWKGEGATRQNVMCHDDGSPYQVRYLADEWVYDITDLDGHLQYLKYWDFAATSYTFSAYAPYTVYDGVTGSYVAASSLYSIGIDADGDVHIDGITANYATSSVPTWMVARLGRTTSPLLDTDLLAPSLTLPALAALNSNVPLVFHRVLSEIEFRAYSTDGEPLNIARITVDLVTGNNNSTPTTIPTTADFAGGTLTNLSTPASRLFQGANLGVTAADAASATVLGTIAELPQSMAGRWIKVVVDLGSRQLTGFFQFPLNADDNPSLPYSWDSDKKYIYTFALTDEQEIILMHFDVADFQWTGGNETEVEDPLTNW